jgi:hypothetical protein
MLPDTHQLLPSLLPNQQLYCGTSVFNVIDIFPRIFFPCKMQDTEAEKRSI